MGQPCSHGTFECVLELCGALDHAHCCLKELHNPCTNSYCMHDTGTWTNSGKQEQSSAYLWVKILPWILHGGTNMEERSSLFLCADRQKPFIVWESKWLLWLMYAIPMINRKTGYMVWFGSNGTEIPLTSLWNPSVKLCSDIASLIILITRSFKGSGKNSFLAEENHVT